MESLKLLPLLLILFFVSCDEDSPEPVESEHIDVAEDMVGYINPNDQFNGAAILYYMQDYLNDVITMLDASNISGNEYVMQAPTVDGNDQVEVRFKSVPVDEPYLFESNDDAPDEIVAKHKIYKNAKCKEDIEAFDANDCFKVEDLYVNTEVLGLNKCVRGTEFCLEIERVVAINKWYEDTLCTILVKVDNNIQFSCEL